MTEGGGGRMPAARTAQARAWFLVYATHRIVEDSTMDTRRFRYHPRSIAAFRWLGWAILMMFVLVQTVQATAGTAAS